MSSQHLSDEAVAAFADGVLRGHARDRAARHAESCAECREAVRGQREAVWALRSAPLPALPGGLADRLRTVPLTTPIPEPALGLPTAIGPDGSTMLAASLVPVARESRSGGLAKPLLLTVAAVALAGGAVAASAATTGAGDDQHVQVHGTQASHHVPGSRH